MISLKPTGLVTSIAIAYVTWKIYGSTFEYKFISSFIGGTIFGILVFKDY